MPSRRQPLPRSRRGALLIVALIFSAIIAISLGSYIRLGQQASELANRSLYLGAAMNAAETGLEEAMWSINQKIAGNASAWSSWNVSGGVATRTFGPWTLSGGATGQVKVHVSNHLTAPVVIARGIVTPTRGTAIEKWVQVTTSKRSKFANGLVAKNTITFSGNNASVDSWNSDPDNDASTAPVAYSAAARRDQGSVGSISVVNSAVSVNNADIWGFVSTGGDDPTNEVGSNGTILGVDSASKDKTGWVTLRVDPDRVATDFSASFDPVALPTTGTPQSSITSSTTLGTSGTTSTYRMTSVNLSSSEKLTINGDVTLILTATSGSTAMDLTGQAELIVSPGSSLKIYTAGTIKIAGNGVANQNVQPVNFQIWGTSTTSQSIDIAGNGALKGIVYAPNANVKINGNGDVMGSVVADRITLTGNAAFHYDESLANLDTGDPLGISSWRELVTMADRNTYASALNF